MRYDVLVYGPVFCDVIFTDLPGLPERGKEIFAGDLTVTVGGSAIVAVGLQRLGARVGLIADLGTDPFSAIVRETLDSLGVDCSLIRQHAEPLPQMTVALSFPDDRAFVTRFQRPHTPPDLAAVLRDHPSKHLHICSFLAAFENPDAAHIAHSAGMTVSLDPGWDEDALRDPRLERTVGEIDLFLPSTDEVCFMSNAEDVSTAAIAIGSAMREGGLLVVKQGHAGATSYAGGQALTHSGVLPVAPVDTTGAGDAFDAGFLSRYIAGRSVHECMRYGAVCGGLSTTGVGGIDALPTQMEVETWLPRLP